MISSKTTPAILSICTSVYIENLNFTKWTIQNKYNPVWWFLINQNLSTKLRCWTMIWCILCTWLLIYEQPWNPIAMRKTDKKDLVLYPMVHGLIKQDLISYLMVHSLFDKTWLWLPFYRIFTCFILFLFLSTSTWMVYFQVPGPCLLTEKSTSDSRARCLLANCQCWNTKILHCIYSNSKPCFPN